MTAREAGRKKREKPAGAEAACGGQKREIVFDCGLFLVAVQSANRTKSSKLHLVTTEVCVCVYVRDRISGGGELHVFFTFGKGRKGIKVRRRRK